MRIKLCYVYVIIFFYFYFAIFYLIGGTIITIQQVLSHPPIHPFKKKNIKKKENECTNERRSKQTMQVKDIEETKRIWEMEAEHAIL